MPNTISDVIRISKAIATNIFAGLAPYSYVRFTNETGRGLKEEHFGDVSEYFFDCYSDYLQYLNISEQYINDYLKNKLLLEYGPGDLPGLALIFYAKGAKKVFCVDRFPLLSLSEFNIKTINSIIEKLSPDEQHRAKESFNKFGEPSSGFRTECIEYLITKKGLSNLNNTIDFVYSRAVLEHVNNLRSTFDDMYRALRTSGIALHKVDLKSHGLHQDNPLDFLKWPDYLWAVMYCNKGVPNRYRLNKYKEIIESTAFKIERLDVVEECEDIVVDQIRPKLNHKFRDIRTKDLKCLSFWVVLKK
ncbi:class I SAM-dependent methyltransferase [Methylicorpusculum oleiharenae]|uniref:methyltransferase domain-containing protein n=1 Tax=Methylicorpusculum oleiharenae TaxID=1338687 RepID=UPI001357CDCB|nr:methyltransferase domain-containing protein [Methylicorpusculum oleiharenae]MCD2451822.1 class I SAM-dependent methyltransferase [Methylicorpusculum oleiharenae]